MDQQRKDIGPASFSIILKNWFLSEARISSEILEYYAVSIDPATTYCKYTHTSQTWIDYLYTLLHLK